MLPKARTDARLPAPLYAYQLKQVGIDIDPKLLMQRAQLEFMETRSAMQQLAPLVVKDKGLKVADPSDPVAVIRALKADKIADDHLEGHYRKVIDAIDPLIREHAIVDVPQRAMQMRLGSAAESAASPRRISCRRRWSTTPGSRAPSCCRWATRRRARAHSTTISTSVRQHGR